MQLFLVFGTSMIHYVNYESLFSHVYSFFAITGFLYFARMYFTTSKLKYFLWACLFFGIVILLRQVNGIVLIALPFIAGSSNNFRSGLVHLYKNKLHLFIGVGGVICVFSVQLILWYLQTRSFLIYSYQGESFDFTNPQFLSILFSYKKGLFIYTPILFFAILGVFVYLKRRNFYASATWLLFFLGVTYILSSWWSWFYGCSFGLRAYIDFYALFFIPIGLFFSALKKWMYFIPVTCVVFLTIPLAVIQTYQYNEFILHWIDMDKEKYWKVFLKTDEQYKGLIWKKKPKKKYLEERAVFSTEDAEVEAFSTKLLFEIPMDDFEQMNFIHLSFYNDFMESDKAKILVTVYDRITDTVLYHHGRFIIHFHESELGINHQGEYYFELPLFPVQNEMILTIEIASKDRLCKLLNPILTLYQLKK